MMRRLPIGEMLISRGQLNLNQLSSALDYQKKWGGRLGHALVSLGYVSESVLFNTLGDQLGVPFVKIGNRSVPREVVRLVPVKLMREHHIFPLALQLDSKRRCLHVAISDPGNLPCLDEVAFAAGMQVKPVLASEEDIEQAIDHHVEGATSDSMKPIDLPEPPKGRMELVERPRTPKYYH